jgi:hypothetical protein
VLGIRQRCKSQQGGVWPGQAGRGAARRDLVWRGVARHGLRWQHGGLTGFPCRLHWRTRRGAACCGTARHGSAGQSSARVTDGGTEGFGFPCHPHKGGRGRSWHGTPQFGRARLGRPRRGKGCRKQHWGLRLPLLLSLEGRRARTRQGRTRRCGVGPDWAGLGAARAADGSTELLRRFPAALIRGQTWHDAVRRGWAYHGVAWCGKAQHGPAWADDLSTEGASPPCWVHSTHFKV